MGAINANLQVTAGQLPSGVCYDHDENARLQAYASRLIVSLTESYATFQYGSVAPTSDLGPWFNTADNNWWVWDNSTAAYILLEPSAVTGQVPIGTILSWAGNIASVATYFNSTGATWQFCNGDAISRLGFPDLFAMIGTQYGVGDGVSTFNIPDCRDLFIAGANLDSGGTAKTIVGDGSTPIKNRAYTTHVHRLGVSSIAGQGMNGGNSYTGIERDTTSDSSTVVNTRVLPPLIALAFVIRTL